MSTATLNRAELATVLAALRYWQREGLHSGGAEHDIAEDGGDVDPLDAEDIDELCGRINCAEEGDAPSNALRAAFISAASKLVGRSTLLQVESFGDVTLVRDSDPLSGTGEVMGAWVTAKVYTETGDLDEADSAAFADELAGDDEEDDE